MHTPPPTLWTLILILLIALLAGCESRPVGIQQTTFNEADFRGFEQSGTAALNGQIRVTTAQGKIAGATNERVYLVPLRPYTEEWVSMLKEGKDLPAPDPRLEKYTRSMLAGSFTAYHFNHLPAGKYLIYCRLTWPGARKRSAGGFDYAYATVELARGENKRAFNIGNDGKDAKLASDDLPSIAGENTGAVDTQKKKKKQQKKVDAPANSAPTPRFQARPSFPLAMRSDRAPACDVVVSFIVTTTGDSSDVRVVSSTQKGFEDGAVQAVKKWKYQPARKDGVEVMAKAQITITFTPADESVSWGHLTILDM